MTLLLCFTNGCCLLRIATATAFTVLFAFFLFAPFFLPFFLLHCLQSMLFLYRIFAQYHIFSCEHIFCCCCCCFLVVFIYLYHIYICYVRFSPAKHSKVVFFFFSLSRLSHNIVVVVVLLHQKHNNMTLPLSWCLKPFILL